MRRKSSPALSFELLRKAASTCDCSYRMYSVRHHVCLKDQHSSGISGIPGFPGFPGFLGFRDFRDFWDSGISGIPGFPVPGFLGTVLGILGSLKKI